MATSVQKTVMPLSSLTVLLFRVIISGRGFFGFGGLVNARDRRSQAGAQNLERIDTIVLEIGDLSLVIPKYVEDIYKVIIKGTPFEYTKLKIEVEEGQGICRDCKRAFPIVKNEGYCPRCGKRNADVISGRDFIVKEVIVP